MPNASYTALVVRVFSVLMSIHMYGRYTCNCFVHIFRLALPFHMHSYRMETSRQDIVKNGKMCPKERRTVKWSNTSTPNWLQSHIELLVSFHFVLPLRLYVVSQSSVITKFRFFCSFVFGAAAVCLHILMRCASVIALCVNGHVSILMIQIWGFAVRMCACVCEFGSSFWIEFYCYILTHLPFRNCVFLLIDITQHNIWKLKAKWWRTHYRKNEFGHARATATTRYGKQIACAPTTFAAFDNF